MDMRMEEIKASEKSLPRLGWSDQPGNLWEEKWSGRDTKGDVPIVGSYFVPMSEWVLGRKPAPRPVSG